MAAGTALEGSGIKVVVPGTGNPDSGPNHVSETEPAELVRQARPGLIVLVILFYVVRVMAISPKGFPEFTTARFVYEPTSMCLIR